MHIFYLNDAENSLRLNHTFNNKRVDRISQMEVEKILQYTRWLITNNITPGTTERALHFLTQSQLIFKLNVVNEIMVPKSRCDGLYISINLIISLLLIFNTFKIFDAFKKTLTIHYYLSKAVVNSVLKLD